MRSALFCRRANGEVCLHILTGLGRTEIAQAMHVKPSTIIYFTRQLYQRLNINGSRNCCRH